MIQCYVTRLIEFDEKGHRTNESNSAVYFILLCISVTKLVENDLKLLTVLESAIKILFGLKIASVQLN